MKFISRLLAFNIIISSIYSLLNNFSQFSFLNCSFIIGILYLLFGLFFYVLEKGFFNITMFAFNKLSQQIRKKRNIICDESNISIDDYIYRDNNFFLTNSLLSCGFLISISTIVISFMLIS